MSVSRYRASFYAALQVAFLGSLLAVEARADVDSLRRDKDGAVFVMTNSTDRDRGNEVAMYRRDGKTGDLTLVGFFPTGRLAQSAPQLGAGAAPTTTVLGALIPATADGHGSSDSITLGLRNRCLFVVNAGTNTVSSFRVRPSRLDLISVVESTGTGSATFPNSLAEHDGVLYVLNAGGVGSLVGFDVALDCSLELIPSSTRELTGITDSFLSPPPVEVLTSPAHIRFAPNGRKFALTIKGGDAPPDTGLLPNGRVVVFPVNRNATLGAPTVTAFDSGAARGGPFSMLFIDDERLIVTHGNSQTIGSYEIQADNSLQLLSGPFPTSSFAPCWLDRTRAFSYVVSFGDIPAVGASPDGNGTIDGFRIGRNGTLEPLGVRVDYPAPSPGMSGNHGIDVRVIDDFIYFVQPRTGRIGRYSIERNGRLSEFAEFGGIAPGIEPFIDFNPGIHDFLDRCFLQDPMSASPECERGSAQGIVGF
jgi:6-phosphogluconolactonase